MGKYYKTENRRKFYKELYAKHEGKCQICGEQERLVVDHDHKTGEMRGLLCYSHNAGLGMFRDDPILLRAAADYLDSSISCFKPIEKKDRKIDRELITRLLSENSHLSRRAVSRMYAELVGVNHNCAQARVNRLVKSLKRKELHLPQHSFSLND